MQNVTKHTPELKLVQAKDLETLLAATERFPGRSDVMFVYARAILQKNKSQCPEALPFFDKALELDDRFVLCRVEKAKCLEEVEGPGSAAVEMKRAIDLNPYSFSTRREVARLIKRHPNFDFTALEGCGDWTKADWVVGDFENIEALIDSNLDLVQMTTKE